jgi:hypothetical protein
VGIVEELPGVLVEEGELEAEAQECLDHRPSSFEKGEPRHLTSYICNTLLHSLPTYIVALGIGVDLNQLLHTPLIYYLPYPCHLFYVSTLKCLGLLRR